VLLWHTFTVFLRVRTVYQVYHAQDDVDHHKYWLRNDPSRLFLGSETPFVSLNAFDDPICVGRLIPFEDFRTTDNALNITTTHGGHCGWYDRIYPPHSWANRALVEIAHGLLRLPWHASEQRLPHDRPVIT
jgi:predicted alpha/beta-fold hydrolase